MKIQFFKKNKCIYKTKKIKSRVLSSNFKNINEKTVQEFYEQPILKSNQASIANDSEEIQYEILKFLKENSKNYIFCVCSYCNNLTMPFLLNKTFLSFQDKKIKKILNSHKEYLFYLKNTNCPKDHNSKYFNISIENKILQITQCESSQI